jgi:hypothetical protein
VPTPAYLKAEKAAASLPNCRRRQKRWEFQQELSFSYRCGGETYYGSGRTKDLSGDGVRFENDHDVPEDTEIELRISWPVRLQDRCPLELVIRGTRIRSDRRGTVVHIDSCEFHTCGSHSFEATLERHSCLATG